MRTLTISKELRFTQHGSGKHLLIALHGYGQLVEFFSKKFVDLTDTVVVCPEGTHRFYLEGTSGRVGASWMTKEWREQDILENNRILEQLSKQLITELQPSTITVLGFSQGVATAARWLKSTELPVDRFIAWAGVFPPDIPFENLETLPTSRFAVLGTEDPYFSGDKAEEMLSNYRNFGFETRVFEGKHELNTSLIQQLCSYD